MSKKTSVTESAPTAAEDFLSFCAPLLPMMNSPKLESLLFKFGQLAWNTSFVSKSVKSQTLLTLNQELLENEPDRDDLPIELEYYFECLLERKRKLFKKQKFYISAVELCGNKKKKEVKVSVLSA